MRSAIARRMVQSKQTAPHFYVTRDLEMDAVLDALSALNAGRTGDNRVSVTALLVRALALTLHEHPAFNAVWNGDALEQVDAVNIGVAIDLGEGGLIAPALLMAPVWKAIADRIGKERGFRLASTVFLVATLVLTAMVWMPGWWILAPVALAGAAYAGMQTLPMAMLPDVIAHDRTEQDRHGAGGAGRSGVFGGVWTAGETTGMALGATVLSIVLAITGYIETTAEVEVAQPDAAVAGIAVAFSLLPAVLMLLSLIVLARYRLREHDIVGTSA